MLLSSLKNSSNKEQLSLSPKEESAEPNYNEGSALEQE
jgi:hypothetical protein